MLGSIEVASDTGLESSNSIILSGNQDVDIKGHVYMIFEHFSLNPLANAHQQ